MPEQHDPALTGRQHQDAEDRRDAYESGLAAQAHDQMARRDMEQETAEKRHVVRMIQANRRSLQLTALIMVLFLIDFFWSVATKHQAETDARQATQIAIAHANQQWCDLVNAINISDAHQPPPATQYGRALNQALAQRYISLGCSPAGKAGR